MAGSGVVTSTSACAVADSISRGWRWLTWAQPKPGGSVMPICWARIKPSSESDAVRPSAIAGNPLARDGAGTATEYRREVRHDARRPPRWSRHVRSQWSPQDRREVEPTTTSSRDRGEVDPEKEVPHGLA